MFISPPDNLKVSQEKPHQDWTIVCKRCTVETVLRRFSHLVDSCVTNYHATFNSNSSFIQHITTSNPKEMYLGLTDIHSDQLSAAVFIFHSAYKLISCCFPFAPWSFVSAVCLLTGLCNEAWRTCETAGEPKRVCSLIWIFQTLWWKVELEFSPPHCTKNVSLTPAFFWWPWRVDVECRFRRNRPMVFPHAFWIFIGDVWKNNRLPSRLLSEEMRWLCVESYLDHQLR